MPFGLQEGPQGYGKAGCLKYPEEEGNKGLWVIGAQLGVLQFLLVTQSSVCGGKGGDTGGNICIYTLDQKLKGLELILRGGGLSFCWRGRKA